jgi:putative membrane protein
MSRIADELAVERTRLANERTLLAYVRTGLAVVAGGLAVLQFVQTDRAGWIGAGLLIGGAVTLGIGIYRYARARKRLDRCEEMIDDENE